MKKLFLMLTAAIACSLGAMAQDSRVATLQHGSGIQAFYGENALNEAHEAAVEGDVITLSSGAFNGCDINKAITIRGEGMDKTIIKSNMSFIIPKGSSHKLVIEGLKIDTKVIEFNGTDGTEQFVISKCYFYVFWWGNSDMAKISFTKCNATFIQSIIPSNSHSGILLNSDSKVVCINSLFKDIRVEFYSSHNGMADVQNCVLTDTEYSYDFPSHSSIKNSIICGKVSLDSTSESSHCLVKEDSSGFSDSWSVSSMDGIFTTDYHLSDNAAATYIGTDGTQIGIYGGMYPYDTTPDYPLVKKLDVIGSHKDGKLNIKINVE